MEQVSLRFVLDRLRRGRPLRPLTCLALSLAAAGLLGGVGLAAAYVVGLTRMRTGSSSVLGDVRDEDIGIALTLAGLLWVIGLFWIWRGPLMTVDRRRFRGLGRKGRRCVVVTLGIGVVAFVLGTAAGLQRWDDNEYLVTAICLLAGACAVLVWLPHVHRFESGVPVVGPGGRVNVWCPRCRYSMAGLRETICPECGSEYTIDELVRAQGYAVEERPDDIDDRPAHDDAGPELDRPEHG